ncbi:MAG: MFS transporter [Synergistaceae bacterium]|nr:MFS transporter [Synergistaceae bacterium]
MKASKQVLLVFLAYYGINCLSNVYFVFGPFYSASGASPRAVGLFLSIFYMAMIICRPLGSWTMERLGIKKALTVSSLISAAAAVGIVFSVSDPVILLFFRAVSGISASVFIVATVAYQSMILDATSRGIGFALFTTGSMLPMATIVPLSEFLLKRGHTDYYLWLPVIVALICLAISLRVRDISAETREKPIWGTYRDMLCCRGVKTLYLTAFLMSLADGATLCAAALAEDRGVPVSWFMISVAAAAVVIRTIGFRIMDRVPRVLLAAPAAGLMGLSLLCLSFSSSWISFMLFGVVYGFGIGAGFPTDLSIIGDLLSTEYHPKATGSLLLAIDLGWVITPLIFGFISPVLGASGAFRLIGMLVLVGSSAAQYLCWMPLWKSLKEQA